MSLIQNDTYVRTARALIDEAEVRASRGEHQLAAVLSSNAQALATLALAEETRVNSLAVLLSQAEHEPQYMNADDSIGSLSIQQAKELRAQLLDQLNI